jgi:hypothetical protein
MTAPEVLLRKQVSCPQRLGMIRGRRRK